MFNYNQKDYLAKAQTIPVNTSADGNVGGVFAGNSQGALCVKIYVNTAMTIATTEVITVDLYDSADDITYAKFATVYTQTASGTDMTGVVAGTKLGEDFVIPPSCNDYVKAYLTTDDAAAAGKLDIYLEYLAR